MLFLDGVYVERPDGSLRFRWVRAPTSAELARLTQILAQRIGRYLERQGLLERDTENSYLYAAFHVQVALSIAMGLGIDYSVYIVARLREEMHDTGHSWRIALYNTLKYTGSAVLISVIVLLGSLIPLMNTELANLWSVSLYIGEALVLDVVIALMFLPLLVYWFKPKFVFEPYGRRRNGAG